MQPQQIEEILKQALALNEIYVQGENAHFTVIVVDNELVKLSPVKQQQTIYAPLMEYFASGEIHALNIRTFTHNKWQIERKLNNF